MIKKGDVIRVIGNVVETEYGRSDGIKHNFSIGQLLDVIDVDGDGDIVAVDRYHGNMYQYMSEFHVELVEGE